MIETAQFHVQLQGADPKTGKLESTEEGLPTLEVSSPPEFGGPDGVWSPEHLLVAAVSSCLMTTFQAIAAMSGVEVVEYSDSAIGYLNKGEDGLYTIETITLRPEIVIKNETKIDRAQRLIARAEKVCLISRSVASNIEVEARILSGYQVGT